jgi:hypothetical protein
MNKTEAQSVANFIANPLWDQARWSGTTFRWHPSGNAPPVMGLCFEKALPAQELFSRWIDSGGNSESLWISIVEGHIPGQRPGYSVHISVNPEIALAGMALDRVVANSTMLLLPSRINRMQYVPGSPLLIPRFKQNYEKHREFLIAPVTRRGSNQFWVDVELGVVQAKVHFRSIADIRENDIDSAVLRPPAPLPTK